MQQRITDHPILSFPERKRIGFTFDGKEMYGFEGDSIASALHANGVRVLAHSERLDRPRGFYCAIGNCSSCMMEVDGIPNVKTCVTPLSEGISVKTQHGKGVLQ